MAETYTDESLRHEAAQLIDGEGSLPREETREKLANKTGVDIQECEEALLDVSKFVTKQNGFYYEELDDVGPSDFNADAEGGTAVGMGESETVEETVEESDTQSDSVEVEVDADAVEGKTTETVDVGSVDAPVGAKTGETWNGLGVRQDINHPLAVDDIQYVAQEYADGVSDVEFAANCMSDPDFSLMLIGEPGVGKGQLIRHMADKTNTPVVRINMGLGMTRSKLVGRFVPRSGEDGLNDELEHAKEIAQTDGVSLEKALEICSMREKFEWVDGLLTKAVRNGWWFLADEINAADSELLLPLNGLLEDDGMRSLEISELSEQITPHENFRFACTRNPAHHAGTKRLNDAFVDRFYEMRISYLPVEKEAGLLADSEDIAQSQAEKVVQFAGEVRNAYPTDLDRTCTFRGCQRIARRAQMVGYQAAARMEMQEGADMMHSEGAGEEMEAVENKISMAFDS